MIEDDSPPPALKTTLAQISEAARAGGNLTFAQILESVRELDLRQLNTLALVVFNRTITLRNTERTSDG